MIVLGFDTDAKGAIAVLDTTAETLDVYPVPNKTKVLKSGTKRLEVDYCVLAATMQEMMSHVTVDVAYLEEQWSRPDQDVARMFTFGSTFGACITATAGAMTSNGLKADVASSRIKLVPGYSWKGAMQLSSDKKLSIALANKLFPECKHAWKKVSLYTSAAEASLIALYGASLEGIKIRKGTIFRPPTRKLTTIVPSLVVTT